MRVRAIDRTTGVRVDPRLAMKQAAAEVARLAREGIQEDLRINASVLGREPPYATYVNGSRSNDLEKVEPGRSIVVEFEIGLDVVQYVWDQVILHSPVKTGRFRDSQRIYADGVEVDAPEKAVGAKEVMIASVVPYARKIEGVSGKKPPESPQAPQGVYQGVAALAMSRYGGLARIKFGMVDLVGGNTMLARWAAQHLSNAASESKRRRARSRDTRQPAVIIQFG